MSLDKFTAMYLDYVNNFLSVSAFAEHYGITFESAFQLIELGQQVGELQLQKDVLL